MQFSWLIPGWSTAWYAVRLLLKREDRDLKSLSCRQSNFRLKYVIEELFLLDQTIYIYIGLIIFFFFRKINLIR